MKLAILSVTVKGAALAEKLATSLQNGNEVAVYGKKGRIVNDRVQVYDFLPELIENIFTVYDGLIFIMATGIVVRMIAPWIQHKGVDPAVVVMDDAGQHVISLLSGHIGGGNELTRQAARVIGAQPVITTATDVADKIAPDVLSGRMKLAVEPISQLKSVNAALANNEQVDFFLDTSLLQADKLRGQAAEQGIVVKDFAVDGSTEPWCQSAAVVLLTDKLFLPPVPHVFLRPRVLAAGVGCRRGTDCETIVAAIQEACLRAGRSSLSICQLASVDVKQNEAGLLAAGKKLGTTLKFFDTRQLQEGILQYGLTISNFVLKQIGVGNVCEAAAILSAGHGRLILPKTRFPQVTVALAEVR